jgi:hypothetical protein
MTIEEIYVIPLGGDGWRVLPSGNKVNIGANVIWPGKSVDAQIGDDARIGDGAQIGAYARIGAYAQIGAYARIGVDAQIGDGAQIGAKVVFLKSPLAVQGTRHLATNSAPDEIQIGCRVYSFDHWTEHVLGIARENGYSKAEALEYQAIVTFIVANGIKKEA